MSTEVRCDVLVVGSGAGGAPVAARLAEAGRKVILVEAGGPLEPGRPLEVLQRSYLHGAMMTTMGNARVAVMAGRALGGTTVVNAGTSLSPPVAVLKEWDARLGTSLYREFPPLLERIRQDLSVTTTAAELLGPSNTLFARGARSLGFEAEVLPRSARGLPGRGALYLRVPQRGEAEHGRQLRPPGPGGRRGGLVPRGGGPDRTRGGKRVDAGGTAAGAGPNHRAVRRCPGHGCARPEEPPGTVAAGAERVLMPWVGAPNEFREEAELVAMDPSSVWPDQLDLAGMHPLGTAALGMVVSPDQQLCEGIWVSDGSLTPGPPGVNPQLTIMAFAERLVGRLLG